MSMALDYDQPEDEEITTESEGLSDSEFESLVSREIDDAVNFIDLEIGPERERAELYYRGAPFGDEQEGRSRFISRDVADTVKSIRPSLMRIFFGPEKIVEFTPDQEEDVALAEQMTDYVNYIVTRDNQGYQVLWDCFTDALKQKCGVIKFWWDEAIEVTTAEYTGLDYPAAAKLQQDLAKARSVEVQHYDVDANGISLKLKLTRKVDRCKIASLPPEEFIVNRRARTDQSFVLIGHRTAKTRSELIALGYDDEAVEGISADEGVLDTNLLAVARRPNMNAPYADDGSHDESQRRFQYFDGFVYIDKDRDGIAELHRVCAAGTGWTILHTEEAEWHNFAVFHADPEPHTFFGSCPAEYVMDIQKTKSGLGRAMFDSLAQSIFPRTVVAKGQVELADLLNTEVGAIIRANSTDAVRADVTPFVGKEAFPMLAYMDEVRESRTGMSKSAMGLEPGTLQNMTAMAAANQFTKAHEHIEIIARNFAETGMKTLFRGIAKLVAKNQRQSRMVALRNKWEPVDPRSWKVDMDIVCNVALGAGTNKEKLQVIGATLQKQEQLLMQLGPQNPLCTLKNYYETLAEGLSLSGFKNPAKYFTDPDTAEMPEQPEAPPDPKAVADLLKAQNDQKRLELEYMKFQADQAQKSADRDQDTMLRLYEINAKNQAQMDAVSLKGQFDMVRVAADLKIQESEASSRLGDATA